MEMHIIEEENIGNQNQIQKIKNQVKNLMKVDINI